MKSFRLIFKNWFSGPFAEKWISRLKKVSLPGFEKVPVYFVLAYFFSELKNDRITTRASSIAFFAILAFFPGISFLFTLLPYIPVEGLSDNIFQFIGTIMPLHAFTFLSETIRDILSVRRLDLLSFGFLLSLYFATSGILAIMHAFHKGNIQYKTRNYLKERIVALRLTVIITLVFLIFVFLTLSGKSFIHFLREYLQLNDALSISILFILRWVLILGLLFFVYSFIYYYAPARKQKFKFISTGSTFAALLSILVTYLFSSLVNNFNLYNNVYGSIGALLAVMLWFYLNSLVLLIGFELNTGIDFARIRSKNAAKK